MSLRWWWASRMTGRCTRWQRWLPGSGGGLKVLNWNLHSFQLLDIIQVFDSISWVRCASGNVKFLAKSLGPRQNIVFILAIVGQSIVQWETFCESRYCWDKKWVSTGDRREDITQRVDPHKYLVDPPTPMLF